MYVEMHFGLKYLGQLRFHEIFLVRDHPFKTWTFFLGGGSKIGKFADGYLIVKKTTDRRGVGVKNHEKLPTS